MINNFEGNQKGNRSTNRLIHEKSPYLLQHAHNPVDWYPWEEEAFLKAAQEDKPIFLSIGYSTCHWCHVMAHESFEDDEVAAILNERYISIKVDREERPDIDHIYMTVCQALTGQGGWPLTVIMTPDKKPFFAGTYFPKHTKYGRIGILDLLSQIADKWHDERDKLIHTGRKLVEYLQERNEGPKGKELTWELLDQAFEEHKSIFDTRYGGFGSEPKFPSPHHLTFLLRYGREKNDAHAIKMVTETLTAMAKGGIYDHIGYGFARYSVDEMWLVPHFEKMLYDNALLSYAYLEAYQVTDNQEFAKIAKEIFTYIERDMTSPEGGFYSAEDADSEGEEGKFYVWRPEEIKEILGDQDGGWFCQYYDITDHGNFEEHTSIINRIQPKIPDVYQETNVDMKSDLSVDGEKLAEMKAKVFLAREQRVHPHKDDKILTAWNSLMIVALAKGAQVFQEPKYREMAERNVQFIYDKLVREDGRLLARYRDGEAAVLGYLDDYAFLIWGLMELYRATFDTKYIEQSIHWTEEMLRLFWDEENGGFFFTGNDGEMLIARPKEIYDGAMPSGNSVAAYNLLRLARMTGNNLYLEKAEDVLSAFSNQVEQSPFAFTMYLHSVLFLLQETKEIVFTGERESNGLPKIGAELQKLFLPDAVILYNDEKDQTLYQFAPYIEEQKSIKGNPTLYLCYNYACQEPTTNYEAVIDMLR